MQLDRPDGGLITDIQQANGGAKRVAHVLDGGNTVCMIGETVTILHGELGHAMWKI